MMDHFANLAIRAMEAQDKSRKLQLELQTYWNKHYPKRTLVKSNDRQTYTLSECFMENDIAFVQTMTGVIRIAHLTPIEKD